MEDKRIAKCKAVLKKLIKKTSPGLSGIEFLMCSILCMISGLILKKTSQYPPIASSCFFLGMAVSALLYILVLAGKVKKRTRPIFDRKFHARRERIRHIDASANKPISVALLCDSPAFWTSFEELYDLLKEDADFDVTLVAIPGIQNGKIVHNNMTSYFEKENMPFMDFKQFSKALKRHKFHYVFPSRPYDHVRPPALRNEQLKRYAKLSHIAYGTCIFSGKILNIVCGFHHLKEYDFVFSETIDHMSIYQGKKQAFPKANTEIVLVGSPKFDYIYYRNLKKSVTEYQQVILYTPRWTLADGTCSFFELYQEFFVLARENPQIKYIFRPHPLMQKTFVGNIWTQDEWEEFLEMFDKIENAVIDMNPDYIPTFQEATVLVSDMSSLLPEFLLTGKPVIYFHKKYQFNVFGKHIAEGYYWCHSWDEVGSVLQSLRNGNDPKASERERVIEQYFYFPDKSAATMIQEYLFKDYYELLGLNETVAH